MFLPAFLLCYFLFGRRNIIILAFSLFFYFFGEGWIVLLLLGSVLIAWLHGVWVIKNGPSLKIMWAATVLQLGTLFYFKYSDFFVRDVFLIGDASWTWPEALLPIGISFFIFQGLSYSFDIHRGKHKPAKSFIDVATYVSMFPQLIAGPIVRYGSVAKQLQNRTIRTGNLNVGIYMFCVGLAQKMLIANKLAVTADGLFGIDPALLTTATAWTASLSYTGQIYFDFAGYSNMAIGLGFMMGFRFPKNFNHPYVAKSITDFWRRWHISMTSWFRDYVYFPLGGNRKGNFMTYRNLFLVFLVSGLWHGAAWTFVLWGMYHGAFLVIERLGLKNVLAKTWGPIAWFYTFVVAVFGWVLFRADTLPQALDVAKKMIIPTGGDNSYFFLYSGLEIWIAMGLAVLFASNFVERQGIKAMGALGLRTKKKATVVKMTVALVLFLLCLVEVMSSTYNPFIYFRF